MGQDIYPLALMTRFNAPELDFLKIYMNPCQKHVVIHLRFKVSTEWIRVTLLKPIFVLVPGVCGDAGMAGVAPV